MNDPHEIMKPCFLRDDSHRLPACTAAQDCRLYVNTEVCNSCPVGRIYKETGCKEAYPDLNILTHTGRPIKGVTKRIYCRTRKTDLPGKPPYFHEAVEYCKHCPHPSPEAIRELFVSSVDLLESRGFETAHEGFIRAKELLQEENFDEAINLATSALESTMARILQEKSSARGKRTLKGYWEEVCEVLLIEEVVDTAGRPLKEMLNVIFGKMEAVRCGLSAAHGRAELVDISYAIAEFSMNISLIISTLFVKRYIQLRDEHETLDI